MNCVQSWQVYNFGSYMPIKTKEDVSHTAIQITYSSGNSHIYEWGTDMNRPNFDMIDGIYKYPDRIWSGVTGQSGFVPKDECITQEMIDEENTKWREEHDAGQYPNNCRGYAHYIIRYMRGSNTPNIKFENNDPAYDSICASREPKPKRKILEPSNGSSKKSKKRGGKRITRSRISKRSRRTMKIKQK